MDEAVKTPEAVAPETSLSVSLPIGGGPRKTVALAKKDIHPALIFAQNNIEPAAYKQVTERLLGDERWRSQRVFISSPAVDDGKTITAFNLAWALNLRKKPVLLVELNFARPRFRSMLGKLRIRYGIDSALHGAVKPEESVFSLGSDGLHISAVRDTLKAAETARHLKSLDGFLDWASDNYDWVILDCPPVLSPAWVKWFEQHANPVLMVVRAGHTPLLQVRRAKQRLGESLQGALLNDAAESDVPTEAAIGKAMLDKPAPKPASEAGNKSDDTP